jgi:hypothetical protein
LDIAAKPAQPVDKTINLHRPAQWHTKSLLIAQFPRNLNISVRAADVVAGLDDFIVEPLVVSLAAIISKVSERPSVSSRWD